MKMILVSIILLISINTCTNNRLKELSLSISSQQFKDKLRIEEKGKVYDIRMELIELGKFSEFINSDTLFMLETYDCVSGDFYGKMWDSKTSINYTYSFGEFSFDKDMIFTNYTCKLIEKWDVKTIQKEERLNSAMTNPFFIIGSRVVLKRNDIIVDCIGFNEFFLLERDI